jgi:hypothetical protein
MHICRWIQPGHAQDKPVSVTQTMETFTISETKNRKKCTSADGYQQIIPVSKTKNRKKCRSGDGYH